MREPYYFRRRCLAAAGPAAEAEGPIPECVGAERPVHLGAGAGLARALIAQGKMESAIAELEEAARQDPRNPQPQLLLSQTYVACGRAGGGEDGEEDLRSGCVRRNRRLNARGPAVPAR